METRVNRKRCSLHNEYITQACLQDQCKDKRLLCQQCHKFHPPHNIAYFTDKIDTPTLLLKLNYKRQNISDKIELKKHSDDIYQKAEDIIFEVTKIITLVRLTIMEQYNFILDTFDKKCFQKAIDIMGRQNTKQKDIQHIVKRIKFLQKFSSIKENNDLTYRSSRIRDLITEDMRKVHEEIQNILNGLKNRISEYSFIAEKADSQYSFKNKNMIRINPQQQQQQEQKEGQSQQQISIQQQQEQKEGQSQQQRQVQQYAQKKEQSFKNMAKKSGKREKKIELSQQRQTIKFLIDNNGRATRTRCSNISQQEEKAIINQFKNNQFSNNGILKIQTKRECQDLLKISSIIEKRIGKVQELSIKTANFLSQESITELMRNFSPEKISLNNCLNFKSGHIQQIIKKFKNLKFLNYRIDWSSDFQWHLTSLYFSYPQNQNIINLETCQRLINKFQQLENMWINDYSDEEKVSNIIMKIKKLRHICLTGGQKSKKSNFLKQISSKTQLRTFVLQDFKNIDVDTLYIKLFEANSSLQNIVIVNCQNFTDDCLRAISINCKIIKQLCLQQLDQIKGDSIWNMNTLQALSISCCPKINKQNVLNQIHELIHLQFLDIGRSQNFVDNELMKEINKLSKLKFIGLEENENISEEGFKQLQNLQNIQSLICRGTNISIKCVIQFCKKLKKLTKLNIQKIPFKQKDLQQILSLPHLDYLSLSIKNELIDWTKFQSRLGKLKVLAIQSKQYRVNRLLISLRQKYGVNVFKDGKNL